MPQGISIINEIKNGINNFRLTTNSPTWDNIVSIYSKVSDLFSLPAPYIIKDGIRYLKNTNSLVYGKLGLIAIDIHGNKINYTSISECSRALGFGRATIKNCLLTGNRHKGYQFVYNV